MKRQLDAKIFGASRMDISQTAKNKETVINAVTIAWSNCLQTSIQSCRRGQEATAASCSGDRCRRCSRCSFLQNQLQLTSTKCSWSFAALVAFCFTWNCSQNHRRAAHCAAACREVATPLQQQEASDFSNLAQLALQGLTGRLTKQKVIRPIGFQLWPNLCKHFTWAL